MSSGAPTAGTRVCCVCVYVCECVSVCVCECVCVSVCVSVCVCEYVCESVGGAGQCNRWCHRLTRPIVGMQSVIALNNIYIYRYM